MKLWIFIAAAAAGYLVGSINPAIILSKAVYRVDVRLFGSHNPGFTNFNRVFGSEHAWTVFLLDLGKSMLMCGLFGWLFLHEAGLFHLGAAFTAIFVLLGHVYPIWYHFRGGKGVAVMFGAIWLVDWRASLIVLIVFLILMIATRYMSLSVMIAAATAPVTIAVRGAEHPAILPIITGCVLFLILRHHENIGRLIHGTESKFSMHFGKKRQDPPSHE